MLPSSSWISKVVVLGGLGVFTFSALWLALTGNADIRYSADHTNTVPLWTRWLPALSGLLLVRLLPLSLEEPTTQQNHQTLYIQAWILVVAALLFPIFLSLLGTDNLWYVIVKVMLLFITPLIVFRAFRQVTRVVQASEQERRRNVGRWYWLGPVVPSAVWLYLTYATPLATPVESYAWPNVSTLVLALVVGFLVNAVLEEYFYRVWLQTRLELLLGRWPAILLASLLWAVWHVTIQGGRGFTTDLATSISNQGVVGLFLGYLWARYRNMWSILTLHGAMNAAGIILDLLD